VQFSWVKKKFDERLTEEEKMVDFNAMQDALVRQNLEAPGDFEMIE
jgi:hypothetical protein